MNCQKFKLWNSKSKTQHVTHFLKLVDKMCNKYKMDPAGIVEDRERTRFCPQTDRRMGRRADGRTAEYK